MTLLNHSRRLGAWEEREETTQKWHGSDGCQPLKPDRGGRARGGSGGHSEPPMNAPYGCDGASTKNLVKSKLLRARIGDRRIQKFGGEGDGDHVRQLEWER
jgi:hypothetical protein